MAPNNDCSDRRAAIDFLLSEHQAVSNRRNLEIGRGQTYVALFFTLASTTTAFTVWVGNKQPDAALFPMKLILVMLVPVGIVSYIRMVQREIRIIRVIREIGRIRHYFAEIDPSLRPYMPHPVSDDTPFVRKGIERVGLRTIVEIVNGYLVGGLAYVVLRDQVRGWSNLDAAALIVILSIALQEIFAAGWLRRTEASHKMRFSLRASD